MRAGLARVWVLYAATGWLRSVAVAEAWLVDEAFVDGVWLMTEASVAEASLVASILHTITKVVQLEKSKCAKTTLTPPTKPPRETHL